MIDPQNGPRPVPFRSPSVWLATWFGCGLIRPAPGTWGTLGAMPFGIAILIYQGWPALLCAIVIFTAIGLWAAEGYERLSGTHDPSAIVIDEVVGVWIAMLACTATPLSFLLAFALFRLFDIWKPWPVGWADKRLPGAFGVMADDVLAGLIALLLLTGVRVAGLG